MTPWDVICTWGIVWYLHMWHHGIWNVHRVLCGTYICVTMGYGMYTEYCVGPTYVTPWHMECSKRSIFELYIKFIEKCNICMELQSRNHVFFNFTLFFKCWRQHLYLPVQIECLSLESSQEMDCSEELSDSVPLGSSMCGVGMDESIPAELSDGSSSLLYHWHYQSHWIPQSPT